jgi:peptide deformylase
MSVLKIVRMGNPILRQSAEPLPPGRVLDADVQTLIDDMLETLHEEGGLGLAAPQVRQPLRILVVRDDECGDLTFVNPEVTFLTTSMIRSFEGCLSVPGIRASVDRIARLRVCALDRRGLPFQVEYEGYPAIVIQHECDHLDGMLFLDRCITKTLAFVEEVRRFGPLDPVMLKASRERAPLPKHPPVFVDDEVDGPWPRLEETADEEAGDEGDDMNDADDMEDTPPTAEA